MTPEAMARLFHDTYEQLAPLFGYQTRSESAVPSGKQRHPVGSCIVCDLNRLDEKKPARPLDNDGDGDA